MIKFFKIIIKYYEWIGGTIFVMFFMFLVFKFYMNSKEIKILHEKGILGDAYIYKLDQSARGYVLYYKFNYKNIEYYGETVFSSWEKKGNRLAFKYYPVVFDTLNPSNSYLLFFNRDFEYFNFPIPDSIIYR